GFRPALGGRWRGGGGFRVWGGAFVPDMGGLDQCSEVKLGLLRQLAAVTVKAELLAAQMFSGEPINVSELCKRARIRSIGSRSRGSLLTGSRSRGSLFIFRS